jgi:glycosyltransferase involved in cell wall biosynthesis
MGICLNMIVRNESGTLPRLFASLAGAIDYYVISDTGSEDNTIEVIRALGRQYGIPGEVVSHAWVDFAHNRNLALRDALDSREAGRHHCQWLMLIDADETLIAPSGDWKTKLVAGNSYYAYKKTRSAAWAHLFLIWIDGQSWHWEGKVHNYLVNRQSGHRKEFILDANIRYHDFEGAKSHRFADPYQKAREDVRLLEDELQGQEVTAANMHRHYQLAYCYLRARDDAAAMDTMRKVVDSGLGSAGRKYTARIFIAECLGRLGTRIPEAMALLDQAIDIDPMRKEALYYKALLLRREGAADEARTLLEAAEALPWPEQGYFMWEDAVYNWKIAYELAFIYFSQGRYDAAAEKIRSLKKEGQVPAPEYAFLEALEKRLTA